MTNGRDSRTNGGAKPYQGHDKKAYNPNEYMANSRGLTNKSSLSLRSSSCNSARQYPSYNVQGVNEWQHGKKSG